MEFSKGFRAMYEAYVDQLAYERLGGEPIPEFWYGADDSRTPVAEADRAMAKIRCLEFGAVLGRDFRERTGKELNGAMWGASGMILASKDYGNGVQDFSDRVQYDEGFTVETAKAADDILERFLEVERTRPQA